MGGVHARFDESARHFGGPSHEHRHCLRRDGKDHHRRRASEGALRTSRTYSQSVPRCARGCRQLFTRLVRRDLEHVCRLCAAERTSIPEHSGKWTTAIPVYPSFPYKRATTQRQTLITTCPPYAAIDPSFYRWRHLLMAQERNRYRYMPHIFHGYTGYREDTVGTYVSSSLSKPMSAETPPGEPTPATPAPSPRTPEVSPPPAAPAPSPAAPEVSPPPAPPAPQPRAHQRSHHHPLHQHRAPRHQRYQRHPLHPDLALKRRRYHRHPQHRDRAPKRQKSASPPVNCAR